MIRYMAALKKSYQRLRLWSPGVMCMWAWEVSFWMPMAVVCFNGAFAI